MHSCKSLVDVSRKPLAKVQRTMLKPRVYAGLILASFYLSPAEAQRSGKALTFVVVNGIPVDIWGNVDADLHRFAITVDERVVSRFYADSAQIRGVYERGRETYVLIEMPNHGSAGGSDFVIIDLSDIAKPATSKVITGHVHLVDEPRIDRNSFGFSAYDNDRMHLLTYQFANGFLSISSKDAFTPETGPHRPPGGDAAAFLVGKPLNLVLKLPFFLKIARNVVPPEAFLTLVEVSQNPVSNMDGFQVSGDYVFIGEMKAHDPTKHVAVVANHSGGVWFLIMFKNQSHYYGNPTNEVKSLLDRALF